MPIRTYVASYSYLAIHSISKPDSRVTYVLSTGLLIPGGGPDSEVA